MSDVLDWDEFRLVRAIAETQSLYGAATRLGLNHSTMFRRLSALETRLGLKLFERDRSGYRPTAAGEDMVALATLMGETISEFERRIGARNLQLSGRVGMTCVETLGCLVLPRFLAEFRALHPGVQVELTISEPALDLTSGDIDIAVRVLRGPPPEDMICTHVAMSRWAVYAAPSLVAPGEEERLSEAPWIMLGEGVSAVAAHRWLSRNVDPPRRVAKASSLTAIGELAAQGVGAALLPRIVGDAKSGLNRFGDADGEADGQIWVIASPHALHKARVRALYDHLVERFSHGRAPEGVAAKPSLD